MIAGVDIWGAFIGSMYVVLNTVVSSAVALLPTGFSLPADVAAAFYLLGSYLEKLNTILPVDTMITVVLLSFSFRVLLILAKVAGLVFLVIRGVRFFNGSAGEK